MRINIAKRLHLKITSTAICLPSSRVDKITTKSGVLSITVRWAFVPPGQPIQEQAAITRPVFFLAYGASL